jgi:hypothetical protein
VTYTDRNICDAKVKARSTLATGADSTIIANPNKRSFALSKSPAEMMLVIPKLVFATLAPIEKGRGLPK